MKRKEAVFIILACSFMFVELLTAFFCIQNKAYLQYYGTAIDSQEKVYIGTNYGIDVYNNKSEKLYTITPVPKGYTFTIHNDLIYIKKNNQYVGINTVAGEKIELIYYAENLDLPEYMKYSSLDKKRYISDDGNEYKLKKQGIYLCVIKNNNDVIYQEPTTSAVLRLTLKVAGILTIISWSCVAITAYWSKNKY